jgi:hypothetical protein
LQPVNPADNPRVKFTSTRTSNFPEGGQRSINRGTLGLPMNAVFVSSFKYGCSGAGGASAAGQQLSIACKAPCCRASQASNLVMLHPFQALFCVLLTQFVMGVARIYQCSIL